MSPQLQEVPESRFNANGMAFTLDRDDFSRELARLLEESLDRAGVDIEGLRVIKVQVDYLDFMFQGPCYLDYRVFLGGEPPIGLQSTGDSSNFAIACRRAFESAVTQMIADPRVRVFLVGE